METHLFILLLCTGVLPLVLSVPREYRLIQQGRTWDEAQAYCRDTYTDLATIASNGDMTKLQAEAQAHQFSSGAWIGLYININSWYWSFNNEPLGSFTPWKIGEPDGWGGYEQCGGTLNGEWGDMPCYWNNKFVCFDGSKTVDGRYILINMYMTWKDAQSYCRQQYTDLAPIRDATENSVVGELLPGNWIWFGLFKEPQKWSDQTTDVSFIQLSPTNINNLLINKLCGFLSNGVAEVALCSDVMPFFCYAFPKHQQIIRVKVKSSEDVNDPAVTAAMLEKIKQKLKDHGLSGKFTVKWRKQPDGLVFHKEENITRTMKNT